MPKGKTAKGNRTPAKGKGKRFHRIKVAVRKTIRAAYDDKKHWRMDPRAYVLVRVNADKGLLEVGIVNPKTHTVHTVVTGKDAREIYHTIARMKPFTYLEHYSYLGRELMKAQIALRLGLKYTQDSPLPLGKLKEDKF